MMLSLENASYDVSDLGLIERTGSTAQAINDRSEVIGTLGTGGSKEFSPQANHSFLWSSSKATDFGRTRAVLGINNIGEMVGIKYPPKFDAFNPAEMLEVSPILYSGGKWKSILPEGAVSGSPAALNDNGQVAGQLRLASAQPHHLSPAVWRGSEVQLLEIPTPYTSGVVREINNAGQAVGFLQQPSSNSSSLQQFAVLWDTNGATPLGSLPEADQSEAVAINNNGCILGVTTYGSAAFGDYAKDLMEGKTPSASTLPTLSFGGFLWDKGTLMALVTPKKPVTGVDVSKGYLPRAINDDCVVVGRATDFSGKDTAFIWHDNHMTDLNTLIPAESGWTLTDAKGLNSQGQIVGQGKYNGQSHAFLLTPAMA